MQTMLTIIHVLVCIFLTLVVLLQQGNKQGVGGAFGGGGSATVFGGRGANTFLQKLTAAAAIMFMVTSLSLSYLSSRTGSVMADEEDVAPKVEEVKPKADPAAAPAQPAPAQPAPAQP